MAAENLRNNCVRKRRVLSLPPPTEEIKVTYFTLTINSFQNAISSATACFIPSHIGGVVSHIAYRVLSGSITTLLAG